MMERQAQFRAALSGASPVEALEWALKTFGEPQVGLASSFGVEDQLLTHWLCSVATNPVVFSLDTGRQFQATYDCMAESARRYQLSYQVYLPDPLALKEMIAAKGPNSFYQSVENRKECCHIRKVEPLRQALSGLQLWVTGQRREQSVTRNELELIEWDSSNGLWKLNPLVEWDEDAVWKEIKALQVPYNKLHDQGFPSIGCEPCTRKVEVGQDARSGRWWWESPEHKECGLHNRPALVKGS